jgi:hypothetical protein
MIDIDIDNAIGEEIISLFKKLEDHSMVFYGKYDLVEITQLCEDNIADKTYDQSKHQYELYFLTAYNSAEIARKAYNSGDCVKAIKFACSGNLAYGCCGADYAFKVAAGKKGVDLGNSVYNQKMREAQKYYLTHKHDFRFKNKFYPILADKLSVSEETIKKWLLPCNLKKS